MVLCEEHKPMTLAPGIRGSFSLIQSSIRRFLEHLEKALSIAEKNKERTLALLEKDGEKPLMTLKDRRVIYKIIEQYLVTYQSLFVNLQLQKCKSDDENVIIERDENLLQIKNRTKHVDSTSYKIKSIVDEDKFKTGWAITFNKERFPWKNIKFKIWNQEEWYEQYERNITNQEDFVEYVLSTDQIKDLYKEFAKSYLGKQQNRTFLRVREKKSKEKPVDPEPEPKGLEYMDTEETINSERFNSQPSPQK